MLALTPMLASMTTGCSKTEAAAAPAGIEPKKVADMLHIVMAADRTTYVKKVVNRFIKEQKVQIKEPDSEAFHAMAASEEWENEHGALPLPAQMFRMGAELAREKAGGMFDYQLISEWPINKQNAPRGDVEKKGLEIIRENKGEKPFYGEETIAGKRYFTALYADLGVAAACVDCHNMHPDSPREDFKLGDVMGGVVIRIPVD
jgi:hypothetical protein